MRAEFSDHCYFMVSAALSHWERFEFFTQLSYILFDTLFIIKLIGRLMEDFKMVQVWNQWVIYIMRPLLQLCCLVKSSYKETWNWLWLELDLHLWTSWECQANSLRFLNQLKLSLGQWSCTADLGEGEITSPPFLVFHEQNGKEASRVYFSHLSPLRFWLWTWFLLSLTCLWFQASFPI